MPMISEEVRKDLVYSILEMRINKASHARTIFVHPTLFCMLAELDEPIPVEKLGVIKIPMGIFLLAQDQYDVERLGVWEIRFYYPKSEDWDTFTLDCPIAAVSGEAVGGDFFNVTA